MDSPGRRWQSAARAAGAVTVLLLLAAAPATADGVAWRVKDLNVSDIRWEGGDCGEFQALGGFALFAAGWSSTGCELFRTNGDPSGSGLLEDLVLGPGTSSPEFLGVLGPELLFRAESPEAGGELWASDGTAPGTHLVTELRPGPASSWFYDFTTLGPLALFFAVGHWGDPPVHLVRTDGTAAGTYPVADLEPWDVGAWPRGRHALALGGRAYFAAADGAEVELWASDGSAAGTARVADVYPGPQSSNPGGFAALGGGLYFFADGAAGRGLWRSDGTAPGTVEVRDQPYSESTPPSDLVGAGGRLFFAADDGVHGQELWASDGTTTGTALVHEILPGPGGATVVDITANGARIYFYADDGVHGSEPWVSDGTEGGTYLIADVRAGSPGSWASFYDYDSPPRLAPVGGRVVFVADDGVHGAEPWTTDGTQTGTQLLADVAAGADDSYPELLGAWGSELVFAAGSGWHRELYRTDGTPAGTVPITALGRPVSASRPQRSTDAGGTLYFAARSPAGGVWEWPWVSDGTEAGTVPLAGDLQGYGTYLTALVPLPGRVLGVHSESDAGDLLWSADGATITPIGIFETGCGIGHTCGLFAGPHRAGDVALFGWGDDSTGWELWSTDGTAAGTDLFLEIRPGWESSAAGGFQDYFGGQTLFQADDLVHGREPWVSAGTLATTHLLADLRPGAAGSGFDALYPFEETGPQLLGLRYVSDPDPYLVHNELDRIDLGAGGSANLQRLGPDFEPWQMHALGRVGDRELFRAAERTATDIRGDYELWATDGTPEGTGRVRDIWPGAESSRVAQGVVLRNRFLFTACDPTAGCELWASDGTPDATGRVRDLVPGWRSSFPTALAAIAGRVYFAACQDATGCEPWITDGTAAGTHRAADIAPGAESSLLARAPEPWYYAPPSDPPMFVLSGDRIYFAADDGTGTELWAMRIEIFYDGFETGDISRWVGGGPVESPDDRPGGAEP